MLSLKFQSLNPICAVSDSRLTDYEPPPELQMTGFTGVHIRHSNLINWDILGFNPGLL